VPPLFVQRAASKGAGHYGTGYVADPSLKGVSIELYQVVAARRMQWDNLIWQVPVLTLTAEAFLFTIALSSGNSRLARLISSSLALIVAFLAVHLMARDRQAELTDADWLRQYEEANFDRSFHGRPWQEARSRISVLGWVTHLPGFLVWVVGFSLFAAAAFTIFLVTLVDPSLLD
jgi:hypothetical protein